MAEYQFTLGKNGGQIRFKLDDDGLTMRANHLGEQYNFKFLDGMLKERITSDWFANQNFCLFDTFHEDAGITVTDNMIEFVSHPKRKETGEVISQVKVTNRFVVLQEQASVIQETYFEVDGPFYDCSPFIGRVELDTELFDKVGNDAAGFSFVIKDLQRSNIGYPKELVLKGENSYLKVNGGLVALCKKIIESHINAVNYNDTLSYYNEENSIFTVYSFEECNMPVLPSRKQSELSKMPEIFVLDSGKLHTEYEVKQDGIAQWHWKKEQPLVALQLRKIATGEMFHFDTLSGWGSVSVMQEGNQTEFLLSAPGGIDDVALKLTAETLSEQNRLEWDVTVINNSTEYSLLWCTYPRLYCDCQGSCHLFMPDNGGTEFCNFSDTDNYYNGSYPGGFFGTMAYMAVYAAGEKKEKGLYYAIHDPSGGKKEFQAASTQTGSVRLTCRYYAEGWGQANNTNRLPGKTVWQSFDGDWFDATEIYRAFVQKECFWGQRSIDDKQTPLWMQDIPFWVMDWVPQSSVDGEPIPTNLRTDSDVIRPEDWYENVICLQQAVGVPIGYHVYNWHKIPFNNDFPHFLPAKETFKKGMQELKKHDIRIMPYINALLWDTKDGGNADFEFEAQGRPGAVKTEDGNPTILRFESRESDGKLVELAAMCPSYPLWRKKLEKLTTDMFRELDVDAIYLDQIAARIPHLCMDESHPHPKGGGSWWTAEYNELMKELNRHKPVDKAFTTESNAEVFAAHLDGFLSWAWVRTTNDVPAFMRIYSDIIKVLGRNINGYIKHSDMHWKYHFAQSLLCGQQLGWVNADVVKMPDRLDYIKKLISFRYEYREFFRHVTILRPPVVQADRSHMFHSDVGMSHAGVLLKPYICAGALQNGRERMIVLVNIGKEEMTDVISFNPKEYNPGKSLTVLGDGAAKVLENGRLECTVSKESYLCIKWEE